MIIYYPVYTKSKPKSPTGQAVANGKPFARVIRIKPPSLTITECSDGTVLVKCWSGCTTDEIVKAIGLELKDLFVQQPDKQGYSDRASKKQKCPSQKAIEHEQLIIQIAQSHLKKSNVLNPTDHQRYQQAKKRLSVLTTKAGVGL